MGIGSETIELLLGLRDEGYLRDRSQVMEIGAQQLANTFLSASDRIAFLGKMFGISQPFKLPPPVQSHLVHGQLEHLNSEAPFARDFWLWLGFDYAAVDIDGSPGSIPLDLNYDSVPSEQIGKYDLVTNFGTTEHVANQLNAFKLIHDLTRHGGLMMHQLPAQGMLNHGLVNYNLKFFWMLGRSNGYKFVRANFHQSSHFYGLPQDLQDFLDLSDPSGAQNRRTFKFADAALSVVLEKSFDIPFVSPIDVASGTQTDIVSLRTRYWTVFQSDAFDRLETKGSGPYRR